MVGKLIKFLKSEAGIITVFLLITMIYAFWRTDQYYDVVLKGTKYQLVPGY